MIQVGNLTEGVSPIDENKIKRKLLVSKIETLNNQLNSLLQKKIRIELEIKRTRKRLSKLKSESQTMFKTAVQLEGIDPDSDDPKDIQFLIETWSPETIQEFLDLGEQEKLASELIQQSEEVLPEESFLETKKA
jgi:regulator of replication initiation timing